MKLFKNSQLTFQNEMTFGIHWYGETTDNRKNIILWFDHKCNSYYDSSHP